MCEITHNQFKQKSLILTLKEYIMYKYQPRQLCQGRSDGRFTPYHSEVTMGDELYPSVPETPDPGGSLRSAIPVGPKDIIGGGEFLDIICGG